VPEKGKGEEWKGESKGREDEGQGRARPTNILAQNRPWCRPFFNAY